MTKIKKIITFSFLLLLLSLFFISTQSVTFMAKSLKNGDSRKENSYLKMDINFDVTLSGDTTGNFQMDAKSRKNINKKEKILSVKDDKIEKLEVFYELAEEVKKDPNKEEETIKMPVDGNTYVLELINEELNIFLKDMNTPTNEEVDFIKDDYNGRLESFNIQRDLAGKTVAIGEDVDLLKDSLKSMLGETFKPEELKDLKIILKEIKKLNTKECGVFEINIMLEKIDESGMKMTMKVDGELYITTNETQPLKIFLQGPVTLDAENVDGNNKMVMKGKGGIEMSMENSY